MVNNQSQIDPPETFLVFDTETGGFPSKKISVIHPDQPPTVQLGAMLVTREWVIAELSVVIACDDRKLNPHAVAVHGMDRDFCNRYGIRPGQATSAFLALMDKADVLVCHNFDFDSQMIEMLIATHEPERLKDFYQKSNYCTMKKTTMLCNIPGRYGKPKWPKLEELHKFLFDETFDGAHDAMVDVRATVRCFMDKRVFPF